MMKRILSFVLGAALVILLAVPVSAADDNAGWVEVLEHTSVLPNGSNVMSFSVSPGSFVITLPSRMRVAKVDLLFSYPDGAAPSEIQIKAGAYTTSLTLAHIDATTTRAYGTIPEGVYESLVLRVYKNNSQFTEYQLLSFRVSPVASTEMNATGSARLSGQYYDIPFALTYASETGTNAYQEFQFPITVTDWQKFDSITVSGSVGYMALNSIRCTIGGLGLPYEMSYAVSNSTGAISENLGWNEMKYYSYDESYKGTSESSSFIYPDYHGKVLFTVTIDLSMVDRTSSENLVVYFTCLANEVYGYSVQILRLTGTVNVADTSNVSWWAKFTSFMNKLFGIQQSNELNELGGTSDSISQGAADIHDFEQSQQTVLDSNFSSIQSAVTFTSFNTALVFVQRYANMAFDVVSPYAIVFTLPLFLGLFFYLCSRIPGATRWKSKPPKGDKSP